jgi:putative transposase
MPYNSRFHHRRSVRLPEHDYRQAGMYFVTICTYARQCLFDDPRLRHIVERRWEALPHLCDYITLDHWVVMPNHVHGVIHIHGREEDSSAPTTDMQPASKLVVPARSLAAVVRTFKSTVSKQIHKEDIQGIATVWQRGYWERIIRDEAELTAVRRYIADNPVRWAEDRDNLDGLLSRMESIEA